MPLPLKSRVRLVKGTEFGMPLFESVGVIQSRSASRLSWHDHPGSEVLFVLDGATSYETASGSLLELPGGCFTVIPPRTRHRGSKDVRMPATMCGLLLAAPQRRAASTAGIPPGEWDWMRTQLEQHALTPHPMGPELQRAVRTLRERAFEFLQGADAISGALGLRLSALQALFEAANQCSQSARFGTGNVVARACLHLESHSDAPLDIHALEKITGYGRARLFALFKQNTGLSPNDYLQRFRLRKALELLGSTQLPITEIAHTLGYSSSQYFSKVFRKYAGQTPRDWRASTLQAPSESPI
jgi:AraC-like DNA-binding protein